MPNLDRTVTIQSASRSEDSYGEPIPTWSNLITNLPCEYLPLSGVEQLTAGQRLASHTARFRVRYRTDITREMRLVYDSQTYDIQQVEEDRRYDRRQYMILTAELRPAP